MKEGLNRGLLMCSIGLLFTATLSFSEVLTQLKENHNLLLEQRQISTFLSSNTKTIESIIKENQTATQNTQKAISSVASSVDNIYSILGDNFRLSVNDLQLTVREIELLEKTVQAEAGCQGFWGKFLVANVIINRHYAERFPDSVVGVIYQSHQFEVISNNRIHEVIVDEETKEAVQLALVYSYTDALFFYSSAVSLGPQSTNFFNSLEELFTYKDHVFLNYHEE